MRDDIRRGAVKGDAKFAVLAMYPGAVARRFQIEVTGVEAAFLWAVILNPGQGAGGATTLRLFPTEAEAWHEAASAIQGS